MIISPPFLPARRALSEDAWLAQAMAPTPQLDPRTGAPEGSFPLGGFLNWHTGMHLTAPAEGQRLLPVCAVASGTVVYVNRPTPANSLVNDAQNYNPFDRPGVQTPAWTDNGCVIVKHETEIGHDGNQSTQLVFYSLYHHLSALAVVRDGEVSRRIDVNDRIERKAAVGVAGSIYGHTGQIHFEIALDHTNLQQLIGRAPQFVAPVQATAALPAPSADGRADCIFGSVYVYLPANAATSSQASPPAQHQRRASGDGGGELGRALWVKLTYRNGVCDIESFDESGASLGTAEQPPNAEYGITAEASRRHATLPDAQRQQSSPSGWYELLRFGRNVGWGNAADEKDLLPEDVAHWRLIMGPERTAVWADLNAPGTFKFSDADFPAIAGWNFIQDDSNPDDQRCDSDNLKLLIRDPDPNNADRMLPEQLARRLGNQGVRDALKKTICRFPCEWDRSTVSKRYEFVGDLETFKAEPDEFLRFQSHLQAISLPELPALFIAADWHVHPIEFIQQMRRVGWLDEREFVRVYRRTSRAIREQYRVAFNQVTRKYLYAQNPLRLSHFLGQGAVESARLTNMLEASMRGTLQGNNLYGESINPASRTPETQLGRWYGAVATDSDPWFGSTKYNSRRVRIASSYNWRNGNLGDPHAQQYRGRGFKQLTGLLNYSKYWVYRGWLNPESYDDQWWDDPQYAAHNAAGMRRRVPNVPDPQRVTETPYNCMDTGGWFLGSERPQTLARIDEDSLDVATLPAARVTERNIIERVTFAINGGAIGLEERITATREAKEILL